MDWRHIAGLYVMMSCFTFWSHCEFFQNKINVLSGDLLIKLELEEETLALLCDKLWSKQLASWNIGTQGGFHFTSSPPCWWTENKRSLISSLCLSTSICSFHHCHLCLPRLHENHLYSLLFYIYKSLLKKCNCSFVTRHVSSSLFL